MIFLHAVGYIRYKFSNFQKKLNEAFATKNLEKFKMLLYRPIKKSLMKLNEKQEDFSRKETSSFFLRFNLFRNFAMQSDIEKTSDGNYQLKFPYSDLLSQKILCYRKAPDHLSLLEKIMREPASGDYIAFVWNECDFWREASFLTMVI